MNANAFRGVHLLLGAQEILWRDMNAGDVVTRRALYGG